MSGYLILISGPSGSGKDTLVNLLLEKHNKISRILSRTSRKPRYNNGILEQDGIDFHFRDLNYFQKENFFLEKKEVYKGIWYATPLSPIIEGFKNNELMIKTIDIEGSIEAKNQLTKRGYKNNFIQIGILPKSIEVLKQRLEKRSGEINPQRIQIAQIEIDKIKEETSNIIINDNLDIAYQQFEKLILENMNVDLI